jgi:choline monooxygenase
VVVVQDRDGAIRAHSAVCRHRAAVVVEGEGNCKAFQCPYHNWTYSLEGNLISTPGRPHPMDDVQDFDVEQYGLHPIRVEMWGGFLFITFNPDAAPLMTWLGDLPERTRNYKLNDMRETRRLTCEVACNWKISTENDIEEYHGETVHKKHRNPLSPPAWRLEETGGPYEVLYGVRNLSIQNTSILSEVDGLSQQEREGTFWFWIHPNMALNLNPSFMLYRLHFPLGPRKTQAVTAHCFPASAITDGDPGERDPDFYRLRDEILAEDLAIFPSVQRGAGSRFQRPGRYSPREEGAHRMANYALDRVLG